MSDLDSLYLRITDDHIASRLKATLADYQAMVQRWTSLMRSLSANPKATPVIVGSPLHRAKCVGIPRHQLTPESSPVFQRSTGSLVSQLTMDIPEYVCSDFIEGLPLSAIVRCVDSKGDTCEHMRFFTILDEGEDVYVHVHLPPGAFPLSATLRGTVDPAIATPVPGTAFRTILKLTAKRKKTS